MAASGNKVNKNKRHHRFTKKDKPKLEIIFDENERKEFLTGFRKRKMKRKIKAQEELDAQLKVERKKIRVEAKEAYKRLVSSQKPIPELEDLWSQEVDMDTHSVTVTELSAASLSRQNNYIGANQVKYEDDSKKVDNVEKREDGNVIKGMEGSEKRKVESIKKENELKEALNSAKDVKNYVRKQATQLVHQSKVFQKKKKVQKFKDIKIRKREERRKEKRTKLKDKRSRHKRN